MHPDAAQTFGFDRGQRILIQESFPQVAALVDGRAEEAVLSQPGTDDEEARVFAFVRMPFGNAEEGRFMVVGLSQPLAVVQGEVLDLGRSILKILLVLSVVGVGLGWLLLGWLDGNTLNGLRLALGVVIVLCAVLLMAQKYASGPRRASRPAAMWFASVSSGVLGGLFSTAGPPIVYHLYRQPLDAALVRQILTVQFLIVSFVRAGLAVGTGSLSWPMVGTAAVAVPVVWGVTTWQARHPIKLPQAVVDWLVCGLLMLAGLSLFVPR